MSKEERKHVLVTGGTNGIGLSIASLLCSQGFRVSIIGRDKTHINNLLGSGAKFYYLELAKIAHIKTKYQQIELERGTVDILVNAAAYLPKQSPFSFLPLSEIKRSFNVNVIAPFLLCKLVLKSMLQKNAGVIINISSLAAIKYSPGWVGYNASKAGLTSLTLTLNSEVQNTNIRVYCVNPGPTRTKMRKVIFPNEDPKRLPTPQEHVGFYLYLIQKRPLFGQVMIDLYDWIKLNPQYKNYGRKLAKEKW